MLFVIPMSYLGGKFLYETFVLFVPEEYFSPVWKKGTAGNNFKILGPGRYFGLWFLWDTSNYIPEVLINKKLNPVQSRIQDGGLVSIEFEISISIDTKLYRWEHACKLDVLWERLEDELAGIFNNLFKDTSNKDIPMYDPAAKVAKFKNLVADRYGFQVKALTWRIKIPMEKVYLIK